MSYGKNGLGRTELRPRHAIVLLGLLVTAACASRGGDLPYAPAGFVGPSAETIGALEQDLPLGPLDLLRITVFRVPDLTGEYRVAADGRLDMPLIGQLDVRDKTGPQVARMLEETYARRYLNNPDVTVRTIETAQNRITVEGGVVNPGIFALQGKSDLLAAIALAKGINQDSANPRRVAIFRKVNGQRVGAAFDLVDIRRGKMLNPEVYAGDTIVVDSSSLRASLRDLLQVIPSIALFRSF